VVYAVDIATIKDGNGDSIGNFQGLLEEFGPLRDNGYAVSSSLNFMAKAQTCRTVHVPILGRTRLSMRQGREGEEVMDDFEPKANGAVIIELTPLEPV
jgi:hypothetical protein